MTPCSKCPREAFFVGLCLFHYREWRRLKNGAAA